MITHLTRRILTVVPFLLISPALFAAEPTLQFEIEAGEVRSHGAFCYSPPCPEITARLRGTFTATINDNELMFSEIDVSTTPDIGFELPRNPNEDDPSGILKEVAFEFDGTQLDVAGSLDMRAFDGPLTEYTFVAKKVADVAFNPNNMYLAVPDLRRCAAPKCGGMFVRAVNGLKTRCADGTWAKQCYVASIERRGLDVEPFQFKGNGSLLLQGRLESRHHDGFGDLGVFVAQAAYRPATENLPEGLFVGVESSGIMCITTPCFSFNEFVLNTPFDIQISGFDLQPSGASEEAIAQAMDLMANGGVVIAAGHHQIARELNGYGINFKATQFYLPIDGSAKPCAAGYENQEGRCITPRGCEAPLLELETIGGAPIIDPVTGEQTSEITYSCVKTCESPAEITGPGQCRLAMPSQPMLSQPMLSQPML